MADIKFSIIIPLYCKTDVIDRCLKSVYNQLYKHYEVILINGVSDTDYSYLNDTYGNLNLIQVPEDNGRSLRQIGLDNTTGDWVIFIDPDDELYNSCTLMTISRSIRRHPNDVIVKSEFTTINEDSIPNIENTILSSYTRPLYGIIYNIKFLKENNIRFCEVFDLFEDHHFNLQCRYNIQYKYDGKGIGEISPLTYTQNISNMCVSKNFCREQNYLKDECIIMNIDMLYDIYDKFSDVLSDDEKRRLVLLMLMRMTHVYFNIENDMFLRVKKLVLHVSNMIDRFASDFDKSDRFAFHDFFKSTVITEEMKPIIDNLTRSTNNTYETFMYCFEDIYLYRNILSKR